MSLTANARALKRFQRETTVAIVAFCASIYCLEVFMQTLKRLIESGLGAVVAGWFCRVGRRPLGHGIQIDQTDFTGSLDG